MSESLKPYAFDPANGGAFDDADVARAYRHRAPYARGAIDHLLMLAPRRGRALDLGCGPGKLALALAPHFAHVDAVDPSAAMIDVALQAHAPNIAWICATAEDAPLHGAYDLVVAGTSLHWMDHTILFPRLKGLMAPDAVLAAIEGDGVSEAPWRGVFDAFITDWLARLGTLRNEQAFRTALARHETHLEIAGRERFSALNAEAIGDFIEGQHSRATWTRARLGPALTREFDRDLTDRLSPYAEDGILHYTTETRTVWGRPL